MMMKLSLMVLPWPDPAFPQRIQGGRILNDQVTKKYAANEDNFFFPPFCLDVYLCTLFDFDVLTRDAQRDLLKERKFSGSFPGPKPCQIATRDD